MQSVHPTCRESRPTIGFYSQPIMTAMLSWCLAAAAPVTPWGEVWGYWVSGTLGREIRAGPLVEMTLESYDHAGLSASQIAWSQDLQRAILVHQLWSPNPMICFCFSATQKYKETTCSKVSSAKHINTMKNNYKKKLLSMVPSKCVVLYLFSWLKPGCRNIK